VHKIVGHINLTDSQLKDQKIVGHVFMVKAVNVRVERLVRKYLIDWE
jgi:hypothetical protein